MQAYEGYFENGRFCSIRGLINIPEHKRVFITVLDEPPSKDATKDLHLAAMDDFISTVKASDEIVPDFERVNFTREVDL